MIYTVTCLINCAQLLCYSLIFTCINQYMKMINCVCYVVSLKKFSEFHGCVRQWMMCILNALIVKKYIKCMSLQKYFVLWFHVYMLSVVGICLWWFFIHSQLPTNSTQSNLHTHWDFCCLWISVVFPLQMQGGLTSILRTNAVPGVYIVY